MVWVCMSAASTGKLQFIVSGNVRREMARTQNAGESGYNNKIKQINKNHPEGEKQADEVRQWISTGLQTPGD